MGQIFFMIIGMLIGIVYIIQVNFPDFGTYLSFSQYCKETAVIYFLNCKKTPVNSIKLLTIGNMPIHSGTNCPIMDCIFMSIP